MNVVFKKNGGVDFTIVPNAANVRWRPGYIQEVLGADV